MGLFSFNCKSCGHPALYSTLNSINWWMNDVVVIFKDGQSITGMYNGYGTVGSSERRLTSSEIFTLYHTACWEVLGKPAKYAGKSKSAADQGHFYAPGAHDMANPRGAAPKPTASKQKFSLATQITRQKAKLATINRQIAKMTALRVDAERNLAKLCEQHNVGRELALR